MTKIKLQIASANEIKPTSWLATDKRYKAFVKAYQYATTQSNAIPALSKATPEEIYYAVDAILRGMGVSIEDVSSFCNEMPDIDTSIDFNDEEN